MTFRPCPSGCGRFLSAEDGHDRCLQCLGPEVHEELTKSWMAPLTARSRSSASSILTTLDGGVARGTRAFPRWREQSRCTCAHETPPLGGTVRVSRPRPVSWQPLSRPKLIALRARQPPPCTPWLSCRFSKPRRSNRCTRVVPTRGWCRSCARDWLRSMSDESHNAVLREGDKSKPNQWTHLSPFYTHMHEEWLRYAKSTIQFHWRFLFSQRWSGLPSKSPMSSRHNVSVPSIRERGLRT